MNAQRFEFILELISRKWNILPIAVSTLGFCAAILAHRELDFWNLKYTSVFIVFTVLISIIIRCISISYLYYMNSFPVVQAKRYLKGEGLYQGNYLFVFTPDENINKGQLLTMFCKSSGATQPILILEVINSSKEELLAISIAKADEEIWRKYFEEESRLKMLFASPKIISEHFTLAIKEDENEQPEYN